MEIDAQWTLIPLNLCELRPSVRYSILPTLKLQLSPVGKLSTTHAASLMLLPNRGIQSLGNSSYKKTDVPGFSWIFINMTWACR